MKYGIVKTGISVTGNNQRGGKFEDNIINSVYILNFHSDYWHSNRLKFSLLFYSVQCSPYPLAWKILRSGHFCLVSRWQCTISSVLNNLTACKILKKVSSVLFDNLIIASFISCLFIGGKKQGLLENFDSRKYVFSIMSILESSKESNNKLRVSGARKRNSYRDNTFSTCKKTEIFWIEEY